MTQRPNDCTIGNIVDGRTIGNFLDLCIMDLHPLAAFFFMLLLLMAIWVAYCFYRMLK